MLSLCSSYDLSPFHICKYCGAEMPYSARMCDDCMDGYDDYKYQEQKDRESEEGHEER